jgi:hypothetical protein
MRGGGRCRQTVLWYWLRCRLVSFGHRQDDPTVVVVQVRQKAIVLVAGPGGLRMTTYRMAITVAFTSFATLVFQLTQTRILSYIFWNHAVYLTVSLALLGFGISGTFVALFASTKHLSSPRVLARLLTGFGVSSIGAIVLTAGLLPHLGWEPA